MLSTFEDYDDWMPDFYYQDMPELWKDPPLDPTPIPKPKSIPKPTYVRTKTYTCMKISIQPKNIPLRTPKISRLDFVNTISNKRFSREIGKSPICHIMGNGVVLDTSNLPKPKYRDKNSALYMLSMAYVMVCGNKIAVLPK